MKDQITAEERRSISKIYNVSATVDGPSLIFSCPSCQHSIRTYRNTTNKDYVPVNCPNCQWGGKVKLST